MRRKKQMSVLHYCQSLNLLRKMLILLENFPTVRTNLLLIHCPFVLKKGTQGLPCMFHKTAIELFSHSLKQNRFKFVRYIQEKLIYSQNQVQVIIGLLWEENLLMSLSQLPNYQHHTGYTAGAVYTNTSDTTVKHISSFNVPVMSKAYLDG